MANPNWRVLVVEDEPDGQMVVAGLLDIFHIGVDAVGTAEQALAALERSPYTCAIIDLALPGMDGEQLMKRIRRNPTLAGMPCVAITAYHTSSVKQHMIDAGFDAYFAKPLDDTSFVREITRVINTHQQ